jgi:hypothetical protein
MNTHGKVCGGENVGSASIAIISVTIDFVVVSSSMLEQEILKLVAL